MLVDDFEDFQEWTDALWDRAGDSRKRRVVVRTAIAWSVVNSEHLHAPDAIEEDMQRWLAKLPAPQVERWLHALAAWGWFDIDGGDLVPSLAGVDNGSWPEDLVEGS